MEKQQKFLAVDIGATSGRTILASLSEGQLTYSELTRFENPIIPLLGHSYWDIYALYAEIVKALREVSRQGIQLTSIGIDTWGVDFACFGADGTLLGCPISYRDPHTEGSMQHFFGHVVDKAKVYDITGIQFMNINSLFQLYAMKRAGNASLAAAEMVMFVPDALTYMLTGKGVCEYSIASTSQLLNPKTHDLDDSLLDAVGMKRSQFGPMVMPGTVVGPLSEELQRLTGLGPVDVVAVAGHDTASAVAAVPAANERFAYLSSGTWSLMGIEVADAIINQSSFEHNFTNEGGVAGTTRFLKNICGMWLYERCRAEFEGPKAPHDELHAEARQAEPFRSIIDPDHPMFANPDSMISAIQQYCRDTSQPVPESRAEIIRCIFDSLALRYRQVFGYLCEVAPFDIDVLHIIGGGSRNNLLNQFTANACQTVVLAGPQEATAIGNIMLQAKAKDLVDDIWQMRDIILRSEPTTRFEPCDAQLWEEAYGKYLAITASKQ